MPDHQRSPQVVFSLHVPRTLIAALLALAIVVVSGCASSQASARRDGVAAPRVARINHVVLFKLKNPADAAQMIADADSRLSTLPMITTYFCGQHLDTGRGEPVDANYDVGFFTGFASAEDYAAYVDHPEHVALVAKWQPRWEWIRIYDVLDDTP